MKGVTMLSCGLIELSVELYRAGHAALPEYYQVLYYLANCQLLA